MKKGKRSVTAKLVVILELKGNEWKETGYRVKEKVRGKTCSRNYSVRLLLQLLSILLYDLCMRIETKNG